MPVVYSQHGVIVKTIECDVIGGRRYKTVQMPDGKTWMAENLDFKFCNVGGSGTPYTPNAWYYDNNETTYGWNGYKCGLLYNWYAVKILNGNRADLCPGWHVPTVDELTALVNALGGINVAGTKLKAANVSWDTSWNGTDDYGFGALPAGGYKGQFYNLRTYANFWTSTEYSSSNAYLMDIYTDSSISSGNYDKIRGYSVRLVKDV